MIGGFQHLYNNRKSKQKFANPPPPLICANYFANYFFVLAQGVPPAHCLGNCKSGCSFSVVFSPLFRV